VKSFLKRQPQGIAGLEISPHAIRWLELSGTRSYEVQAYASAAMPEGALNEQGIVDAQAVADAILAVKKKAGSKLNQVAISLSGNAVFIKKVSMPLMSELQLESEISFEAEQHIPFEIQDVALDFQILSRDKENESMDVLLLVCKQDVVDAWLSMLERIDLHVRLLDCSVFCLANVYAQFRDKKQKKQASSAVDALFHLGGYWGHFLVSYHGQPLFMRDQALHLAGLLQEIVDAPDYAQWQATGQDTLPALNEQQLDALATGLLPLMSESIDYYMASHGDHELKTINLSGVGAVNVALLAKLSHVLGLPCKRFDPLLALRANKKTKALEGSALPIVLGLALRGASE